MFFIEEKQKGKERRGEARRGKRRRAGERKGEVGREWEGRRSLKL